MNNTVLKIIAGLLLLGAIAVAYVGVRLSQQPPKSVAPPAAQVPASVPTEAVAVAARTIRKGQAVGPADTATKGVATPPASAYRDTGDAFGKVALADIPAGTVLTPLLFAADSMASLLLPGERAVALQVDEVVGVGGYAKPGDRVDVLVYIPANKETRQRSVAQIVIHDAGVLAMGEANRVDTDQLKRTQSDASPSEQASANVAEEVKARRQGLRSAVIAVRENEVTRLMLAAGSGQLRLALRPQVTRKADPLGTFGKDSVTNNPNRPSSNQMLSVADLASVQEKTATNIIIQEGSKERPLETTQTGPQP